MPGPASELSLAFSRTARFDLNRASVASGRLNQPTARALSHVSGRLSQPGNCLGSCSPESARASVVSQVSHGCRCPPAIEHGLRLGTPDSESARRRVFQEDNRQRRRPCQCLGSLVSARAVSRVAGISPGLLSDPSLSHRHEPSGFGFVWQAGRRRLARARVNHHRAEGPCDRIRYSAMRVPSAPGRRCGARRRRRGSGAAATAARKAATTGPGGRAKWLETRRPSRKSGYTADGRGSL